MCIVLQVCYVAASNNVIIQLTVYTTIKHSCSLDEVKRRKGITFAWFEIMIFKHIFPKMAYV